MAQGSAATPTSISTPAEASEVTDAEAATPKGLIPLDETPKLHTPAEWPWQPTPRGDTSAAALETGDAEGSSQGGSDELSFRQNMWDRYDFLGLNRLQPSQRLLEQVVEVLRSRAELERKYGESLVAFSCGAELKAQEQTVHAAVDSMMVNFRNRGEHSLELAEEIEQEIVTTFETVLKQHREVAKRMQTDVQLLARYAKEKRHAHEKCARRYGSMCTEAEAAANECLQGLAMKSQDRMKIAQQATALSKQARLAEHEYYASIEQANRAQALLEQHLPQVLTAMQSMEEKRGTCLKDGLMKLAVYETSWLRNLQYDIENSVKAGESADPSKDVQDFIEQNKSEKKPEAKTPVGAQPYFKLAKPREAPKQTPALKQQFEAQEFANKLIGELRPQLRRFLGNEALSKPEADEVKEQIDRLRQGLADQRRRAALCKAFRLEVLSNEEKGAELDSVKSIRVEPTVFEAIVPLFRAALDACDEHFDAWCGRDLMVLAQLFRTEGEGGKPVLLHSKVYNHPLWNKVTFWEEVLLVGLFEAHSAEAVTRRSLPPGSQFSKPAMTAFLQKFVGYMLAFGISIEQGRSCVWATLRKHAQHLGNSSKAYANELLKAYEASAATASASSAPAPAPRRLEESTSGDVSGATCDGPSAADGGAGGAPGADGPAGGVGDENSVPAAAMVPEDDFEALALGVPSEDGPGQEALPTSSNPSCEEGSQGAGDGREATRDDEVEAAVPQPTNSDVFA